ncbi:DMT family transporter [Cognatishimia activa]|nr:DMT family transporter [Cognatishimia activa]
MDNLRAMGLMGLAMACFAAGDGMIKLLTQSISRGQVMVFMGLGGVVVFALLCRQQSTRIISPLFFRPIIVLRNVAEVTAAVSFFTAFTLAPLSSIAAIMQTIPLILTVTAAVFLKEHVGPRRWGAVFIGMIGVMIILRPDSGGLDPALLLAVLGTLALAARDLAARLAPQEASTPLLSLYAFGALIPVGFVLSWVGEGNQPISLTSAWHLILMNAFAILGYFCATKAMRIGEVSSVSPVRYTRLPFAAVVGYVLFSEIPDAQTLFGSALIIGAGLFVMLREAQIKS